MNLSTFNFPTLRHVDITFSTLKSDPKLLAAAKEEGFYNGHTPYNDLFNEIFYRGGRVIYKKGLDPAFQEKATMYLKALLNSFEPRHEEKEAICALILSNIAEVKDQKK